MELVRYDFTTDLSAQAGAGVSGSLIQNGALSSLVRNSGIYPNPVLIAAVPASAANVSQAVTANSYFQFTITPDANFGIKLQEITLQVARGGATTPRGYAIRSSKDGYATNIATADVLTQRTTLTPVTISLASAFSEIFLDTAVTFRVYVYAPFAGNSVDFDNIVVSGEAFSLAGINVFIEGVRRTEDIAQNSLRYKQTLSKAPATVSFSIEGNKVMPLMGDAILLTQDGDNFFRGTITDRNEEMRGGLKTRYEFMCMDGFYELDRRLVIKAYNNTTVAAVMTDLLANFTSGFTLDSPATTPTIKTVRFNYEQPSRCIQKLMNAVGWDWYVDQENVVHIFPASTATAPFEVNDTDGNHIMGSLKREKNITELKNVVYIRGGEYEDPIAEADAVDKYEANGVDNTFPLVYRYGDVEVTVNGTPQDVGIDFIDEAADHDCLYNFQEKLVRFPDGTLASGAVVRVFGNAKVPLIVQAQDDASVTAYGEREGLEINKSINSIEEAELLAGALLEKWREGASSASFKTYKKGWVVGQTVTINSPILGLVDDQYKINSVSATLRDSQDFVFNIELIKSGQTTFMDMLVGLIGQKTENITIADNEVLQRIKKVTDLFGMTDEIVSITKTTGPYGYTPVTTKTPAKYDFSTYS